MPPIPGLLDPSPPPTSPDPAVAGLVVHEVPGPSRRHLAREQEVRRILAGYGDDWPGIMGMLERQFVVLHNRAQVLLTLAGIVISTVGFSGRLVAGTNTAAQVLIVCGVMLVLLAAASVVVGVLHLRWLTMQGGDATPQWLVTSLAYRDLKTNYYRVGLVLLILGLACYVGSLSIMLLNPGEDALPVRERVRHREPGP